MLLASLSDAYQTRSHNTGIVADLSKSIEYQEKAVGLTPDDHSDLGGRLDSLAGLYRARFEHAVEGDLTDISRAILHQKKSLELASERNPNVPLYLNNLAVSYRSSFKQTGHQEDLFEAITCQQKAVDVTPVGHADMPLWYANLGKIYRARFDHSGNRSDVEAAVSNFSIAAYSPGSPSTKLSAAKEWIRNTPAFDQSRLEEAYTTVIRLVSEVAGLEQTIEMRYANLIDTSKISTSAAAFAFQLGRTDLALEWLEQGRCLVWSQLNNLRTPIDALRAKYPDEADAIVRVSSALEFAGSRVKSDARLLEATMAQKMMLEEEGASHASLAQEWDNLLEKVRRLPDFENFLGPVSCSNLLKNLRISGAVVVINIHEDRCDALALVASVDEPLHISLSDFSYAKADELRSSLQSYLQVSGVRMREGDTVIRGMRLEKDVGIKDILRQLWVFVVNPILSALGPAYSERQADLSRIWWCATGPLAFLPIHAAGVYDEAGSTPNLCDLVISSYTPTVRALLDRAQIATPRDVDKRKAGLFMISQPNTPKMTPIPATKEEARAIQRLLKDRDFQILCLEGEEATVEQALAEMKNHTCIHFACHASQNTDKPLKSGFALHDGWLELSSIIGNKISGVDLAFLSACQTSTGDEKLSEEAVHLAAGMLAAGFRGVVATVWSIQDRYGPAIAEEFYEYLLKDSEGLSGEQAARALHHATQNLRKKVGDSESGLLSWVPYVHFGF